MKPLIASVGAPWAAVAAPACSPDGKHLAFQRYLQPTAKGYEDDQVSIEVLDLASGLTRIVATSPLADTEYVEYVGPRWSPDSKEIAFMVNTFATPPADDNVRGSAVAVVKADGSEVDAPRILTDASLGCCAGLEPGRRTHRLQHLSHQLLPDHNEGVEHLHHPARRDRPHPDHALRRERRPRHAAELDAGRQADHLHAHHPRRRVGRPQDRLHRRRRLEHDPRPDRQLRVAWSPPPDSVTKPR